ncbi:putative fatty acid elongation protein 3 [Halotydeus destructor]|nr:putative fatty acid elongation protein 3 [Halotydeus destructor]
MANCTVPSNLYIYDQQLFTLPFERDFDYCEWRPWMQHIKDNYLYAILATYVVTVFSLKYIMRNRAPFDLKTPLILWNMALALFSTMGAARVVPEAIALWQREGMRGTMCNDGARYGVVGYWTVMFMLSKIPEFVDTLFIVLRKKPLIFLHYYHHVETCWLCFFGYPFYAPNARWAVLLNYPVHSVMYTYYALRALNIRTPKSLQMSITILQTLQMFIGVYVTVSTFREPCDNDFRTIYAGIFTYSVYAFLFSKFFYQSYFGKRTISKSEVNNNERSKKLM